MKRNLTAVFACCAGLAWSAPALEAVPPVLTVSAEAQGGLCSLAIVADPKATLVYLDYAYKGLSPLKLTGLVPGDHALILRMDGYYDQYVPLKLAADTLTTVSAVMELRTGWLLVEPGQPGTIVEVDGRTYKPGLIQLPSGMRRVTVRAFGYLEREYAVLILDRSAVSLQAGLEPAPFEAEGLSLPWRRFNPLNAGQRGGVRVGWRVTAPGRAVSTITGPDGATLLSREDGPFDDWSQGFTWDGRAADGSPLPDGRYLVSVTAYPAEGVASARESFTMSAEVHIDSAMILTPRGSWSAVNGSALVPDAFRPAGGAAGVAVSAFMAGDGSGAVEGGVATEASFSIEGIADFGLGVEGGDSLGAAWLGARLALPLPVPVSLAVDGRMTEAVAGDPAWVRLALPVAMGNRFLNLTLAPMAGAYWEDGFSARAGLAASLTVAGYGLRFSLSACAMSADLALPPALGWPLATAAELAWIPGKAPLVLRAFAEMDWADGASPLSGWKAGISIWGGL